MRLDFGQGGFANARGRMDSWRNGAWRAGGVVACLFVSGPVAYCLDNISSVQWAIDGGVRLMSGEIVTAPLQVIIGATGSGSLTVAGGSFTANGPLFVGQNVGATGAVWLTGGELVVSNNSQMFIGFSGTGAVTISNGTMRTSLSETIGTFAGSQGTLTVAGGTNSAMTGLVVGDFAGS